MVTPEQVLSYWVDEVGPKGWYVATDELDAQVRENFLSTWQDAQAGACGLWLTSPVGTLGYIVLTDQFPRNMFRGHEDSFATDKSARAAAKIAIERDWDLRIPEPVRQFFYMPLMHSENLIDQDRCVRLMKTRLPESGADNLRHARAHRLVIRQFGRFPFRNEALGRTPTAAETAWISEGGYGAALRAVDELAPAS
ncbi:Uncharacterized conserved protein, DUF924 family [Octadecabacter temperatus]|uniref:Uncharacterized protein n=1 Tax=Octadecabacter temperatus TaxID=1458307 RepID=A0A0K0Y5Q4_9RHOB|nr:DUF924 family protein [Octadecabacter temperatus]AKS46255.1 hypothetical protein OSB_17070 [Octadecabacter temperatus]SIO10640.1 Uncharacterized conserved protein, DUF924 family [Octadecabacter temperatus]